MDYDYNTIITREYLEEKIIKVDIINNILLILCGNGKIYLSFFRDYKAYCID